MARPAAAHPGDGDRPVGGAAPDTDLSRTYLLVVIVEVVVIAALFWAGRHFS